MTIKEIMNDIEFEESCKFEMDDLDISLEDETLKFEEELEMENLSNMEIEGLEDYCTIHSLEFEVTDLDNDLLDMEIKGITLLDDIRLEEETSEVIKTESKGLEKLMEDYNIPTFVSLSKVVDCKPQYLYSRKIHKTGEYNYESISKYLVKMFIQNVGINYPMDDSIILEEIVKRARLYLDDKKESKELKGQLTNIEKCIRQFNKLQEMLSELSPDELYLYQTTINEE